MSTKTTLKPTTFSTGPNDSLVVADVYDSSSLIDINTDVGGIGDSGGSLLDAGLPPAGLGQTAVSGEFANKARDLGKSPIDLIKEIKRDLPSGASMSDVLKSNKLSDLATATGNLKKGAPGGILAGLNGDDVGFLLSSSSVLTASVLSKNKNLSLSDLQDANGADYAVLGAVALLGIRGAMGKRDSGGLMGIIADAKLPAMFRDAGLDIILDMAAEYGLGDVALSLMGVIGDRSKPKRKTTIRKLLAGFRYSDKPVVTEVSKNERSLITSVAGYFGVDETQSNVLAELIEIGVYDATYLNKREQSKKFVDALYNIDSRWNTAIRNGETISLLDNYRYASKDAIEALVLDERTIHGILLQKDRSISPSTWAKTARIWYPYIYG